MVEIGAEVTGGDKMTNEYLIITGYVSFYLLVIFIGGLFSMGTVEEVPVDDINVFDGMSQFLSNPFTDMPPMLAVLFYIFVLSPMILTASMLGLNFLRGR